MYAREPSTAGVRAAQRFRAVSPTTVVELGAGTELPTDVAGHSAPPSHLLT
jgi:hypothetical protein